MTPCPAVARSPKERLVGAPGPGLGLVGTGTHRRPATGCHDGVSRPQAPTRLLRQAALAQSPNPTTMLSHLQNQAPAQSQELPRDPGTTGSC